VEFHQIRYFLALCETLNFTRAAEACNVSQPSLTRAIKGLEDELGGPLFRRERNQSHLTDLGRLMRPYLGEVWANLDAARGQAETFIKLKDAPLAVGIMCTIGPNRIVELLRRFRTQQPGIRLDLVDGTAHELHDSLENGKLDVAIYTWPQGHNDRFHAQTLYRERFLVAFPPGHRFERMNAVSLKDTHGENYLQRLNCEMIAEFDAALLERGAEVTVCYGSERETWIQTMVCAGLGISFMPETMPALANLPVRPIIEPEILRDVDLVTVRGRPHSPAVGAFVREALRHKWGNGREDSERG